VWVLTQTFDLGLAALTLVTAPRVIGAISSVSYEVLKWPSVSASRHPLGGQQFNVDGVELGHVHSNGVADIRLTPEEQSSVLAKGLAGRHHVTPKSSWVTFIVTGPADVKTAVELLRIPYDRIVGPSPTSESPSEEYVL
jgi:hypothetical protein